jgi:AcrR family transcriptional regulator
MMGRVSRWEPNARGRLIEAALDLYVERGFEQTTVADIARQAGLTERTFFRYFTDKREVLFWGSSAFQEHIVNGVVLAPDSLSPLEAVAAGLEAGAGMLRDRPEFARRRASVIAANAELQERELIKLAVLGAAVTRALRERGVKEPTASLTAEVGIAVFKVAFETWVKPGNRRELGRLIRQGLDELSSITARTLETQSTLARVPARLAV